MTSEPSLEVESARVGSPGRIPAQSSEHKNEIKNENENENKNTNDVTNGIPEEDPKSEVLATGPIHNPATRSRLLKCIEAAKQLISSSYCSVSNSLANDVLLDFDRTSQSYSELYDLEDRELTEAEWKALNESFIIPTPKQVRTHRGIPAVCATLTHIQGIPFVQPLFCLLDSGSDNSLIRSDVLPAGATPTISSQRRITTTANGTFDSSRSVHIKGLRFPEFTPTQEIAPLNVQLFDSPTCRYHLILGRDFLDQADIDLEFSTNNINWKNIRRPMKLPEDFQHLFNTGKNHINIVEEEEDYDLFTTE